MPRQERFDSLPFQRDFSASELSARRARALTAMGTGLAVIAAATEPAGFDPVRQHNDFYYLTGVDVPHAYLTLDCDGGRSVLYLPPRDEKHEMADGPALSDEDGDFIAEKAGIQEVRPISRLTTDLRNREHLWTMRTAGEGARQCQDTLQRYQRCIDADRFDGGPSRELRLLQNLSRSSPSATFSDLSPIVHRLRLIKSAEELNVMRRAAKLAAVACVEAIKSTRPGVFEYQLAAVADFVFGNGGAMGGAYRPIVATGRNISMMHYWRNESRLETGELVLFDYAPDYHGYTSDIGRMWPVNGVYSAQQRELYGFVLEHHRVLLSLIRPGKMKQEILTEAAGQLRPMVEKRRWSKPIYKAAALRLLESTRPLSHGVGMAVHESADWAARPMEPGLVIAVDPELLVPEENLYIRVEDTVVVSETGMENLTAGCPREIEQVERLMREPGLLQSYPGISENSSAH